MVRHVHNSTASTMRLNESMGLRYCPPPCCSPKVSGISAALANEMVWLCSRIASVVRNSGTMPQGSPGYLQHKMAIPPFVQKATRRRPLHGQTVRPIKV